MKFTVTLAALAATAYAMPLTHDHHWEFAQYTAMFGKRYTTYDEYLLRLNEFKAKNDVIKEHNASGEHSYTLGHNQMSDWTPEEYTALLTYQEESNEEFEATMDTVGAMKGANNSPIDWRDYGYVTPIKDQGACGSCWAFSATGAMEGFHAKQINHLVSFSEQQLVDCVTESLGCHGGAPNNAFDHYKHNYVIAESYYPYSAKGGRCQENKIAAIGVKSQGHSNIKKESPDAMKSALNAGPVSVAIYADQLSFGQYNGGVYTDTSCNGHLDHAVLIVGWGTDAATGYEFWVVKNSWNTWWGEQGYMRMKIVPGKGICGINKRCSQPKGVN